MSFVRGHPRDTGWVVGHLRAPTGAEDGQLPLDAVPPGSGAEEPAEDAGPAADADPAGTEPRAPTDDA
ncbi:MAG TPA: hypothetical protein VEZ42_08880 [Pseudonocardia sp.]|nr:hypothetical protein [Pseudonocardia sp.]